MAVLAVSFQRMEKIVNPPLCSRVRHIVRISSEEKMAGIYTVSNIALMTNKQTIRYRAIVYLP